MSDIKNARKQFDSLRLQALGEVIKSAPAPAKIMTSKEALFALAPELKAASQRGHSPASLVDLLAAEGLKSSARAVAQMLRADAGKWTRPKTDSGRKSAL